MNRHKAFPLSFVTTGRRLLLVGGGELGTRRLSTALVFDWARIVFVEPKPLPETCALAESDARVILHAREIRETDVEGADLVIESTLDEALARRLSEWCRSRRIPLNAMDKLDACDVYYPSLIMRGPLLLSINSGGETPALTSLLRKCLEERIGPGWCNAGLLMAEARRTHVKSEARMKWMKEIAANPCWPDLIAENNIAGMKKLIHDACTRMAD